jgi:hypothetical protein
MKYYVAGLDKVNMTGSCGNEEVLTGQNFSPRYAVADKPGCRAHNSGVVGWDCLKSMS